MLINIVLWNYRHPRRYLPEDYHVYLAQDGQTELKGPGWKNEMPWFINFIDPRGLTAAITGGARKKERKKEKPFWDKSGFEHISLVKVGSEDGKTLQAWRLRGSIDDARLPVSSTHMQSGRP